jgi:zinc transport system ATP-binding protein
MREVSPLIDRVFCIDAHRDGKMGRTVVQHVLEEEAEGTRKRVRHDVEIPGDFCHFPREDV